MKFVRKHINAILNRDLRYLSVIATIFVLIMAILLMTLHSGKPQKELPVDIPAYGTLPSLQDAVKQNSELRDSIELLWSYDEAFIFVNDREVNSLIAEILFLWSGFSKEQIKKYNSATLIHNFLRRTYSLPKGEPVKNNPALPENAWPFMFNRYKSRLLMLGGAKFIYKNDAYYDAIEDEVFVNGSLSTEFLQGFQSYTDTLSGKEKERVINNYLSFINETKGLKNLSEKEMQKVKQLR